MLLRPFPDRGKVRAEPVGDDVVGGAHEERPVPHAREPGDVPDHLRVVVGGEVRLALPAIRHGQPPHEVGEPHIRGPLLLRVLVQVVVELPRLVPDPQVVVGLPHDVVEQHEVGEQDLVHPPPRLEAVQVVLGGLAVDVLHLAGEPGRGRMDPFPSILQHAGHRVLGQPVDLQVGVDRTELVGDGHVPTCVAKPDRRADVERSLRPALPPHPPPLRARRRMDAVDEPADEEVDLDRVASVGKMAGSLQHDQPAPLDGSGQLDAASGAGDAVVRPLDHQRRAPDPPGQLTRLLLRDEPLGHGGVGQGLRRRLQAPFHAVLDGLGRVALAERVGEEELQESSMVPEPVVPVVLGPALVGVEDLLETCRDGPLGGPGGQRNGGGDEHRTQGSLRVLGRKDERSLSPHGQGHDDGAIGIGLVQHGQGIGDVLPLLVGFGSARAIRTTVAAAVERHHPVVPGQVRDLHLPVAGVDDGPRRHQQDRRLSRPEDLVEHLDAVAFHVAVDVRIARPHVRPLPGAVMPLLLQRVLQCRCNRAAT